MASADAKKIATGGQTTRLLSSVKRLSNEQWADVSDRATNQEREQIAPVVRKKMGALIRRAKV